MKTITRHMPRIVATAAALLVTTSTAIAFTQAPARALPAPADIDTVGCFVVTPGSATFVAPPATLGRFEVTPSSARYVPAAIV